MDSFELMGRLHNLKIRKTEFARMIGLHAGTVYHWKEVPQYAVALVGVLERLAKEGIYAAVGGEFK